MKINNLVGTLKEIEHIDYIVVTDDIINIIYHLRVYGNGLDIALEHINQYLINKRINSNLDDIVMDIFNYYTEVVPYKSGYDLINSRVSETTPGLLYHKGNYFIKFIHNPMLMFYIADFTTIDNYTNYSFKNEYSYLTSDFFHYDISEKDFKMLVELIMIRNYDLDLVYKDTLDHRISRIHKEDLKGLTHSLYNRFKGTMIFNGWVGNSLNAMLSSTKLIEPTIEFKK